MYIIMLSTDPSLLIKSIRNSAFDLPQKSRCVSPTQQDIILLKFIIINYSE